MRRTGRRNAASSSGGHGLGGVRRRFLRRARSGALARLDAASLGIALLGSVAGTALMQGRGIDVKLSARIDAELGDHRVETTVLPVSVERADAASGLTRDALENFVYQLDNAMAAAAPPSKD